MKKFDFGIVTFFDANNYGAVLQTFALQKFLLNNNYRPCVINTDWQEKEKYNSLRGICYYLKHHKEISKKEKVFSSFISNNTNLSPHFTREKINEANKLCEHFIVGSDQVWNSQWNYNRNIFYLTFTNEKYSYAASFGSVSSIKDYRFSLIKDDLSKFNAISVREKSAQIFLSKLGIESRVHLDPTLLLNEKDWEKIEDKIKLCDTNYVLIYSLENNQKLFNDAKGYAKNHNLSIYCIVDTKKKTFNGVKTISYSSPEQFVALFHYAKCIFTNSFHGTVFSIIFKKVFYAYLQKRKNAPNDRIVDLLEELDLSKQIVTDNFTNIPSFEKAFVTLEKGKKSALDYFKKIKENNFQSDKSNFHRKYYYCKTNKDDVLAYARSGGIASMFSDSYIKNNNSAYGAILENNIVLIKRLENNADVKKAANSKYVESNAFNSLAEVKDDLMLGKNVVYCALPCQIAVLFAYLKQANISTDNLLTIDIVCHGAPENKYFKDYVKYLGKKYKTSITNFNFRDKQFGWDTHVETFFANGKKKKSRLYTKLFYSNYLLKETCYKCPFCNFNRQSDITLMDSWGYTKKEDLKTGSSIAIINTAKGEKAFNKLENINETQLERLEFLQPNLFEPSKKPYDHQSFIEMYKKFGFKKSAKFAIRNIEKIERANRIKGTIVKFLKLLKIK